VAVLQAVAAAGRQVAILRRNLVQQSAIAAGVHIAAVTRGNNEKDKEVGT
jgi:hypothetical protein